MAKNLPPPVPLLFMGASIIQGWETTATSLWASHLAPRGALNIAAAGEKSGQLWWKVKQGLLKGLQPRVVVLQVGANDLDLDAAQVAASIADLVSEIHVQLPSSHVLLWGIFPSGPPQDRMRARNRDANLLLARLHDGTRTTFVDASHLFVEPDGTIPASLMPDGLHLSPAAYERWSSVLFPLLDRLLA